MTIRWNALTALAIVVSAACREHDRSNESAMAQTPPEERTANNAPFPITTLTCADGVSRTMGSSGSLDVIVFASPLDCVLKRDHLDRVREALRLGPKPSLAVIVSSIPVDERVAAERVFSPILDLPLCWDQHARLASLMNIVVGPATVLVRDGRLVWRADGESLVSDGMLRKAIGRESLMTRETHRK